MTTPKRIDPQTARVLGQVAVQALSGILGDTGEWSGAKSAARATVTRDPIDTVLATVTGATMLFYLAERKVNPRVKSPADALVFITTCLSVGYSDIHATTAAGKAIASAIMTVGPSMTSQLFAPPDRGGAPAGDPALKEIADLQRQILARLDALVAAAQKPTPA
ncbi:MAG: ion channel [Deltaproteobacteria bacterium]|nr:ion channel [Myxococcales bacterium]MDP3218212.1 ion channel [Deltaproteobacteria bacterium]